MNIIIKDISKEKAEEVVNSLDKFIDDGIIENWSIDDTKDQDYRSINTVLGEHVSIKPYYRNNSLCFAVIGNADKEIKFLNLTRFLDTMLTNFSEDIKSIKLINL
ncbi:MAG: hypothetical protein FWE18_05605 [Alphaproteobacteria bacterium]|nr:hypothetical protein [Alphaproteobacteria bacterium]